LGATAGIEVDFTTQLLYCAVKCGVQINIADLGMNVLCDLIDYSASVDSAALARAEGKNIHYSRPQTIAEMTTNGKLRG
jgi:hypothetical protein